MLQSADSNSVALGTTWQQPVQKDTQRVAAITVGQTRGLGTFKTTELWPFLDSLGPADVFAVLEAETGCAPSRERILRALGGTRKKSFQRHVHLHMLTSQEVWAANRTLRRAGLCCSGLLQFHKLTIALALVRKQERALQMTGSAPYFAVVKFRHDYVKLYPLLPTWRSAMVPSMLWAHHDQMIMAERATMMGALGHLWSRGLEMLGAGNYHALDWQRLTRDLKAIDVRWGVNEGWAYPKRKFGCSNFFSAISWPLDYIEQRQMSRKHGPTPLQAQRDAAKLNTYTSTNRTISYYEPSSWARILAGRPSDRIIEPEAFLGMVLYDPSGALNLSVRCLWAPPSVLHFLPHQAGRWDLERSHIGFGCNRTSK